MRLYWWPPKAWAVGDLVGHRGLRARGALDRSDTVRPRVRANNLLDRLPIFDLVAARRV